MTDNKDTHQPQPQKSTDEKIHHALFSLEAINKRLAKITASDNAKRRACFSLKLIETKDIGIGTKKTVHLLHGNHKIGYIIYSAPYPTSDARHCPGYSITFFRQLATFSQHGLGTILSLVALSNAFEMSGCPRVFVDMATERHIASMKQFGFKSSDITSKNSPVPAARFTCDNLPEFIKTKASALLEAAFAKLEKAAKITTPALNRPNVIFKRRTMFL